MSAPLRIKVRDLARIYGFEDPLPFLQEAVHESVVPACCEDLCEVELDGHCPHGHPSPFLVLGLV